jgi:hypothetical protein
MMDKEVSKFYYPAELIGNTKKQIAYRKAMAEKEAAKKLAALENVDFDGKEGGEDDDEEGKEKEDDDDDEDEDNKSLSIDESDGDYNKDHYDSDDDGDAGDDEPIM